MSQRTPYMRLMSSNSGIAEICAVLGDPARASMIAALMAGSALTASELAHAARVSPQTTSAHLAKLTEAGLLAVERQGRYRYYRLTSSQVARLVKTAMVVARASPQHRRAASRADEALRAARTCYDHLAGRLGVALAAALAARRHLVMTGDAGQVTGSGARFLTDFGVDLAVTRRRRRVFCRSCLDWTERRAHIAGSLGAALATRCFELGWIERSRENRAITITDAGHAGFAAKFGLDL